MAKNKKSSTKFVWTEKAKKLFGSKVVPGELACFMGHEVCEANVVESWLRHGYIVAQKEGR